jgi:glycosyltransferase involved in cell wall biosynthesis
VTRADLTAPLRVGINLLFLGERAGGVGRYARELPGALLDADPRTEIVVFVSEAAPADLWAEPWARDVRFVHLPVRHNPPPLYLLAQYTATPVLAAAKRLDVLHSPGNVGPAITPGVASVVSLMDVIWLRHAEAWESDPRAKRALRRQVGHVVRHADRIFAISAAAARDISAALSVAESRLTVTPLGVRPAGSSAASAVDIRDRLQIGNRRILLCVAQKRPYKNLTVLVTALKHLPADVVLVLPGSPTPYEQELRAAAAAHGVLERVRFPDWLTDEELEALYVAASAFALPSLAEGFGLPVLEAMARGVPVACSDIPVLAEVAGDAALRFDPLAQDDVNRCLRELLENPPLAGELASRGRERAACFTWRRTGEATLAGYRAALASR